MLGIEDFYKLYSKDGRGIDIDTLTLMTKDGLLLIMDKDISYSLDDVAQITGKAIRTVYHWVELGKLKVFVAYGGYRVTDRELHRFLAEIPIQKSKICLYVKAKSTEEIRGIVDSAVDSLKVSKHRLRIFVDLDGDEGLEDLLKFMIGQKNILVYSNIDLTENKYIDICLRSTYSKVSILK